jgi:hypothetical protein
LDVRPAFNTPLEAGKMPALNFQYSCVAQPRVYYWTLDWNGTKLRVETDAERGRNTRRGDIFE